MMKLLVLGGPRGGGGEEQISFYMQLQHFIAGKGWFIEYLNKHEQHIIFPCLEILF